ncbi:MAG: UvrD-helicase domain-containing protein, partial [Armatimonadetes bacterium]|nr:UvrD-helicase domain-containing protein [Armatimonadota bacterium]
MTFRSIPHEAISASAGSGKTFQLAHRYLRLLTAGVEPDRIAALTFSRKAAGEIFDSIIEYLCQASSGQDAAEVTSTRLGTFGIQPAEYTRMLRQLLRNLHRLHIGTLDSFTVGILRSFPFELGIPPGISLMEAGGAEALTVQQKVLSDLYRSGTRPGDEDSGLLEAFVQASFGKSEKKVEDNLAALIGQYHTYYRLLPERESWGEPNTIWPSGSAWSNTTENSGKARDTLMRLLEEQGASDKVTARFSDFATVAAAYTARSTWSAPLSYIFGRLLDATGELRAGSATIMTDRSKTTFEGEAARCLLALIARVVNTEIEKAIQKTRGSYAFLGQYNTEYERLTRSSGSLTFEDAQFVLTQANTSSGGATISRMQGAEGRLYVDYRLDARLDHWLLDEFQDTSDLQWDILSNLTEEILQDDTGQRSFFFVGDVKQAIYGWRGGNPRLFGMLLDKYGDTIQKRDLVESQRSCPEIVEMVNKVFGALPRENEKLPGIAVNQWERFWQPHRSAKTPSKLKGVAALLEPPCDGGDYKPTREDRYRVVADLLDEIEPLSRGLSIAILVRSNANGKAIVEYLRAHCPGLPVVHEGRAAIVDNPVVSALLSLVKYAAHPGDMFTWRHLQMTPIQAPIKVRRLGIETLSRRLLHQIHSTGFRGLFEDWGNALDASSPLDDFGRERLRQLLTAAGEFDASGSRDCNAFLSFIDKYELHETAGNDYVRVMTIHQSKGLGFDVVILPELDDSSLATAREVSMLMGRQSEAAPAWLLANPAHGIADADPELAHALEDANSAASFESLCLLYVAMTRAKQGLYVVTSFPGKSSKKFDQQALLKLQLTG